MTATDPRLLTDEQVAEIRKWLADYEGDPIRSVAVDFAAALLAERDARIARDGA